MRDKRFVAEHRGGLLTKADHRRLMRWGRLCAEHVLSLVNGELDPRLVRALDAAQAWENGLVRVGEAQKVSVSAHAAAREASDPILTAVARAIGQAAATAHMADHSLGGALYALKAVKAAGGSFDEEKQWQIQQLQLLELPPELVELILKALVVKEKAVLK